MSRQLIKFARIAADALDNAALSARADARPEEASEYSEAAELLRDALDAAQREQAQDEHDAVRIMRTVIDKGHDYVLIVEPRDGGSRFQIHNRLRDIEVARMLERFARQARDDARFGGDE